MNLNVGCGPWRADDWVNTDFVRIENYIEPDVVVDPYDPLPFRPNSFERAYVGHCLEHIEWRWVPNFLYLLAEVVTPDGLVMFVGPDVHRVIEGYKDGTATWHQVMVMIEERSAYTEEDGFADTPRWDADRHWWNCSEDRVVDLLLSCGWQEVVRYKLNVDGTLPEELEIAWPIVSRAPFQFAISACPPERGS